MKAASNKSCVYIYIYIYDSFCVNYKKAQKLPNGDRNKSVLT